MLTFLNTVSLSDISNFNNIMKEKKLLFPTFIFQEVVHCLEILLSFLVKTMFKSTLL